jgi:hypothetical protein
MFHQPGDNMLVSMPFRALQQVASHRAVPSAFATMLITGVCAGDDRNQRMEIVGGKAVLERATAMPYHLILLARAAMASSPTARLRA